MKIKICGLFRGEDIEYVNEARPDYCGFVFAQSRRQVPAELAARLRQRLADGIVPVGVFVNAPPEQIIALYRDKVIDIAQLHGGEDEDYITRLKEASGDPPVPVIQVIKSSFIKKNNITNNLTQRQFKKNNADYYLFDSGAGSGEPFDWGVLNSLGIEKPWFLAGGITMDNIEQAMALNPFAVDISSGAETDGVKDRKKILHLTAMVKGTTT
jgi:phosphoribosylanthranilate isomerase